MQIKSIENQYPYLSQAISFHSNASIVIQAIEQHFSYLFDLRVLEQNAEEAFKSINLNMLKADAQEEVERQIKYASQPSKMDAQEEIQKRFKEKFEQEIKRKLIGNNYFRCFEFCINHLTYRANQIPYTVPEVVECLGKLFNIYDVSERSDFHEILFMNLIFVGDGRQLQGPQLSYVEKIIAGQAKPAGGLTFVDMLRFVRCFETMRRPAVFQLAHLLLYQDLTTVFSPGKNLLINLNQNMLGEPKWAAVHVAADGLQVYCEALLLESEKQQLADLAQRANVTIQKYEGQTAENGVSCGYMAVAWLKNEINIPTKEQWSGINERTNSGQRLNHSSTFWSLREVFLHQLSRIGDSDDHYPQFYANKSPYHSTGELGFNINSNSHNYGSDLNSINTLSVLFNRDIRNTAKDYKGLIKQKKGELKDLAAHLLQVDTFQKNQTNLKTHHYFIEEKNSVRFKIPTQKEIGNFNEIWRSWINITEKKNLLSLRNLGNPTEQSIKILNEISSEKEDYPKFECSDNNMQAFKQWIKTLDIPDQKQKKTVEKIIKGTLKKETPNKPTPNALFLAVFNDAAARCQIFSVEPHQGFALTEDEKKYLISEMHYNPFMQDLRLEGNELDQSLLEFKAQISPILARNRWLAENDYKPPVIADYWQDAARYWLHYLYHYPQILSGNTNHQVFKTSVAEMGSVGLSHLLTYLVERETSIKAMLGDIMPPFYLGMCDRENYQQLTTHLKQNRYFPFGQISLGYDINLDLDLDNDLCGLVNECNVISDHPLEKIELRDVPENCERLLAALQKEAINNHWTLPMVIPNLSPKDVHYVQLNNIILSNRRKKLGQEHRENIEKALSNIHPVSIKEVPVIEPVAFVKPKINLTFGSDETQIWSLQRQQGGAKLQLQYQQQMQQQQQLQQQIQGLDQTSRTELALRGELVNTNNAFHLLNDYYQNLLQEFPHSTLDLKSFFQKVIQAKPDIKAPDLIQYLTQDAAKYLLRQAMKQKPAGGQLRFGLNTQQHLSKGLFSQHTQNGQLVLCYDPERDEEQANPCSLDLDFVAPTAIKWQGDYRQFDLNPSQKENSKTLQDAFDALQPEHVSNGLVSANEALILLMPELKESLNRLELTENAARALGQLYYHLGKASVNLLVQEILELKRVFPQQFDKFKAAFLDPCQNMTILYTLPVLQTLQAISSQFSQPANATLSAFWWCLSEQHAAAVGFERPEVLWRAFQYFVTELQKEGVELINLETLQYLKPMNALVWMDHVLACVRLIPTQDQKQRFIDNLHRYDLTQQGLPYALQYEGFKRIDADLKLAQFESGKPTYAPSMSSIFEWEEKEFDLQVKRLLATQSGLTETDYQALCKQLTKRPIETARTQLICWLFTTQSDTPIQTIIQNLIDLSKDKDFLIQTAKCLHHAVCIQKQPKPTISLAALVAIQAKKNTAFNKLFSFFDLNKTIDLTYLEAAKILYERNALGELDQISTLQEKVPCPEDYPLPLYTAAFKLAALFGEYELSPSRYSVADFIKSTRAMKPAAKEGIDLLLQQLFSIDHSKSRKFEHKDWNIFFDKISSINDWNLSRVHEIYIQYLGELEKSGVVFNRQIAGNLRTMTQTDRPEVNLAVFVHHENRVWEFLQQHITIPTTKPVAKSLQGLLDLLKELQLKRGHVNEIEQLLLVLKETTINKENRYWEVNYFCQLLQSLKPKDTYAAYPISLLKVILSEPTLTAKSMHGLVTNFPEALADKIANIASNEKFTQPQQALLCQLAIREFSQKNTFVSSDTMLQSLLHHQEPVRDYVLKCLVNCNSVHESEKLWEDYQSLLTLKPPADKTAQAWSSICHDWLVAMNRDGIKKELFLSIQKEPNKKKKVQILSLIALSTLRPGLKSKAVQADELNRKAGKLVECLKGLDEIALNDLLDFYKKTSQPVPDAENLLQIIKLSQPKNVSKRTLDTNQLKLAFDNFERNPHATLLNDYAVAAVTRESDFQRLLNETRIQLPGKEERQLSDAERNQIQGIFESLRKLESGDRKVKLNPYSETQVQIKDMTRRQFIDYFNSNPKDNNDEIKLAIDFQMIERVSGKYPHLAQQFAVVIAGLFPSATQVVTLDTGEGKSHFNALRAIHYAMQGKQVYIHTANSSLSERDYLEYKPFFDYLNIASTRLNPNSPPDCLSKNKIIYTTLGERALCEARQTYLGEPVSIKKENCVGILDEIDFLQFEEGLKVEYNFSIPQDKTTEQMRWFYHTLNRFVEENQQTLNSQHGISRDQLYDLVNKLVEVAGDNTSRQRYLADLVNDPLQLVRWVQAAYATNFTLAIDTDGGFCLPVGNKPIEIAGNTYLVREIIPLSSDNQKSVGSTFSGGIQQLLAEKLVNEAIQSDQPQNFYSPPLSHIVSSQIAETCLSRWYDTWVGATGSLSAQQADILQCTVLRLSTNQPCLRVWEEPSFFDDKDSYLDSIAKQTQLYLQEKKSILFACKNDKSVKELYEKLKPKLSKEEFDQLIHLTNDSGETTAAALERKKLLENQGNTTKQQGVGLLASSLGRGDNVEVDAVFVVDLPRDKNTLTQIGGRCGRNGSAGTVHQFYQSNEIQHEYKACCEAVKQQDPIFLKKIEASSETAQENLPPKQILGSLLELKEHLNLLNSAAEHQYKIAKAEYTHWGILILSQWVKEPEKRASIEKLWIAHLQKIDSAWLNTSNDPGKTAEEKAQAIRDYILQENKKYINNLNLELKVSFSFTSKVEVKPYQNLGVNQNRKESAQRDLLTIISQLSTTYIKQSDPTMVRARLEHTSKIVDGPMLWKWLNHYEKLAVSLSDHQKETLLIAMTKAMHSCNATDPDSIDAFDQLLTKTVQWWNKGQGKYKTILLELWNNLGKNQSKISLKDLVALFPVKEPGKLGFTWLASFSQLSPQLAEKNWPLFQTIVPHLAQLPSKKANKIGLLNKIIDQIQKNPDTILSAESIKAVITLLLSEKTLAKLDSPKLSRVLESQQLFLPFATPENSPELSLLITQKIVIFLATTKWKAEEIDGYLSQIHQLLTTSGSSLILIDHLLNFQDQCCQIDNIQGAQDSKKIEKYLQFLNQYPDCCIFLQSDKWLNQRLTEFFEFINGIQLQVDPSIIIQLANFYFNPSIDFPTHLATIYLSLTQIKDVKLANDHCNNILALNRLNQDVLVVIMDHFSTIKLDQHVKWVFNDLQKLPDKVDEKTTKFYLDGLNEFYGQLSKLSEGISEKNRNAFQKLNFEQANHLLSFLESVTKHPVLIEHLFNFFDAKNSEEEDQKALLLAKLFYQMGIACIEEKLPPLLNFYAQMIASLNQFSVNQLKAIQAILQNKSPLEAAYIIYVLAKLRATDDVIVYTQILSDFYHLVTRDQKRSEKILDSCSALEAEKLVGFLEFFSINKNALSNNHQISAVLSIFSLYPATVAEIFLYAAKGLSDEEKNQALLNLLTQKYNQQWKDKNEDEVLNLIRNNNGYVKPLLTDRFLFGYQTLKEDEKADYLEVAKKFYSQDWVEIFDFNKPEQRKSRVILMRLLQQEAFVSLVPSLNEWTAEENQELLNQFLTLYAEESKKTINNSGDLTNEQQAKLLVLADELNAASVTWSQDKAFEDSIENLNLEKAPLVQKELPKPKRKTSDNLIENSDDETIDSEADDLNLSQSPDEKSFFQEILPFIEAYKNLDKSTARETLLANFEQQFNDLVANPQETSYSQMFDLIYQARQAAIQEDAAHPGWVFKLHRKGNSRYFDLLTTLENRLLKVCAADVSQSAEFAKYLGYFRKNLEQGIDALLDQLNGNEYTKLCERLRAVSVTNPATIATTLGQLKHDITSNSATPGHLKALAKPLINQFETYLMYQDKIQTTTSMELAQLWEKLQVELDIYAAANHKSTARSRQFNDLKNALLNAAHQQDYRTELKTVIRTARQQAINYDVAHRNDFFPPHYGGDSRYLTLLNQLDKQVINNKDSLLITTFQEDYLNEKLTSAKDALYSALDTFCQEKENSTLWKRRILAVKELLALVKPDNPIHEASTDEQDSPEGLIKESPFTSNHDQLIQKLKDTKELLPGYLQVLVEDLQIALTEINQSSQNKTNDTPSY